MRQSFKTTALLCCAAAVSMTAEAFPLQTLQTGLPQEQQTQVQQEPADTSVLYFTLEEAMSYALEHNWDLQNSSLSVRQAEADRCYRQHAAPGQRNPGLFELHGL